MIEQPTFRQLLELSEEQFSTLNPEGTLKACIRELGVIYDDY